MGLDDWTVDSHTHTTHAHAHQDASECFTSESINIYHSTPNGPQGSMERNLGPFLSLGSTIYVT